MHILILSNYWYWYYWYYCYYLPWYIESYCLVGLIIFIELSHWLIIFMRCLWALRQGFWTLYSYSLVVVILKTICGPPLFFVQDNRFITGQFYGRYLFSSFDFKVLYLQLTSTLLPVKITSHQCPVNHWLANGVYKISFFTVKGHETCSHSVHHCSLFLVDFYFTHNIFSLYILITATIFFLKIKM